MNSQKTSAIWTFLSQPKKPIATAQSYKNSLMSSTLFISLLQQEQERPASSTKSSKEADKPTLPSLSLRKPLQQWLSCSSKANSKISENRDPLHSSLRLEKSSFTSLMTSTCQLLKNTELSLRLRWPSYFFLVHFSILA